MTASEEMTKKPIASECAPETAARRVGGVSLGPEFWAAVALTVLAALLFVGFFAGFSSPDAMKYADVARNFVDGRGMVSNLVNPLGIIQTKYDERLPAAQIRQPYRRYWGFPLAIAGAFALFEKSETVVALVTMFFWVVAGTLVFHLGRRLFSLRAGMLATAIYAFSGTWAAYAIDGMSESFCLALLLGAAALVLAERRVWPALLAGVLGGLSLFVRQPMLFVTPIALAGFVLLRKSRRASTAVLLLVGFVGFYTARGWLDENVFFVTPPFEAMRIASETPAVASSDAPDKPAPLFAVAKLTRIFGSGLFVFSAEFPGHAMERSVDVPAYTEERVRESLRLKAPHNLSLLWRAALLKLGNPLLVGFFVVAVIVLRRDRTTSILGATILALVAATGAVGLLLFIMPRYFHLYLPLIFLVVAGGFDRWLARWDERRVAVRRMLTAAIVLALAYPWIFVSAFSFLPQLGMPPLTQVGQCRQAREIGRFVAANTEPNAIVFSDVAWITAWHGNRPSIWLPLDPSAVERVARWVEADRLFLSLEDPQGFGIWSQWLQDYREKKPNLPLGDWRLEAGRQGVNRPMFLFARPTSSSTQTIEKVDDEQ